MLPTVIVPHPADPARVLVLAPVWRDGRRAVERYEILRTDEAMGNLLRGLSRPDRAVAPG